MAIGIALLVLGSVVFTSFLSGIFGMAGGMILMGILGLMLSVELAMVIHGTAQLAANGSRSLTLFKHIDWKSSGYYLIGALAGSAALWSIEFVPSLPVLFLLLGLMPFLSLIKSVPKLQIEKPKHAMLAGVLATGAHLTAGVSGPLLDLFYMHSRQNRFQIIGTKALTQSLGHLMKLVYFGTAIDMDLAPSWFFGAVILVAITGTLLGGFVLRRMNDENFRLYTRRIVLTMGSLYLVKAAWSISTMDIR